jgi:hypothetical protein
LTDVLPSNVFAADIDWLAETFIAPSIGYPRNSVCNCVATRESLWKRHRLPLGFAGFPPLTITLRQNAADRKASAVVSADMGGSPLFNLGG